MSYYAGQFIVSDDEAQACSGAGVTVEISGPSEMQFCADNIQNLYWVRYNGSAMYVDDVVRIISASPVRRITFRETSISNLEDLAPLRLQLEVLDLIRCEGINTLEPLRQFRLISLDITGCDEITDLAPVATLQVLIRLVLAGISEIESISAIAAVPSLVYLDLSNMKRLQDIRGISKLVNLCYLSLENCTKIKSLASLERLAQLYDVDVSGCRSLESANELASLPNLARLNMKSSGVRDVTWVETMSSLQRVEARGTCTAGSTVKQFEAYETFGETFSLYSAAELGEAVPPPYSCAGADKRKQHVKASGGKGQW